MTATQAGASRRVFLPVLSAGNAPAPAASQATIGSALQDFFKSLLGWLGFR
jgi:hypothetical protein